MVEIINETKLVTARKAHVCNYCGCVIPVGEKYHTGVFKYDGMIYSWKSHLRCERLVNALNMEGEEGVTGEDFYEYVIEEYYKLLGEGTEPSVHKFQERLDIVCDKYLKQ
jgi:hypothetical protein